MNQGGSSRAWRVSGRIEEAWRAGAERVSGGRDPSQSMQNIYSWGRGAIWTDGRKGKGSRVQAWRAAGVGDLPLLRPLALDLSAWIWKRDPSSAQALPRQPRESVQTQLPPPKGRTPGMAIPWCPWPLHALVGPHPV